MRKPKEAPPQVQKREREGIITQVREYKLITPLFGGGVVPGECDPVTVVRATAIRGHLRFWWRATRGGQFNGDLKAMYEAESLLWGASSTPDKPRPSKVEILILDARKGKPEQPYTDRFRTLPEWRDLAYAAFPLAPVGDKPAGSVVKDVFFKIQITYPEQYRADVEAALWAWETFGGIGARTRRGFGAIRLVTVDGKEPPLPNSQSIENIIRQGLQKYVAQGTPPANVPHLSQITTLKVTKPFKTAHEAWAHLIVKLKNFRQSRNQGMQNRPGRSRWPEPDAIRQLTQQSCPSHSKPLLTIDKFPRAVFGLPIIFHFKDTGDPEDTTLTLKDHDRLASPLILRPYECADGKAVGIALVLEGTGIPNGWLVLSTPNGDFPVQHRLAPNEAQSITPLNNNPDVLKAFLNTL